MKYTHLVKIDYLSHTGKVIGTEYAIIEIESELPDAALRVAEEIAREIAKKYLDARVVERRDIKYQLQYISEVIHHVD